MTKSRVIVAVLVLAFVVLAGTILVSRNSSLSGTDHTMGEVGQVKGLLDSWHGEREILNEARDKLAKILAVDPKNHRALKELSRYQIMSGYMHSITRSSKGGNTYRVGQFQTGTLDRAEHTLKTALEINPEYAEGYVLLGHIYTQQSRLQEARDALSRAEAIGTDDPWLQLNWADLLIRSDETEAAADRYQAVLKSGTKQKKALSTAYGFLIKHYKDRQEYEKVDDIHKKRCNLDATNAWARGEYADFLRKELGKTDEALTYAREALSIMDFGVGRRTLALCLYAKWADLIINQHKSERQAQKYYNEAFQLFPDLDFVMAYEGSYASGKELAKLLVSRDTPVDARAEDGSTALIIASNTGRAEVVRYLLTLGANPNAKSDKGWTPLLGAADGGYLETVKVLLENGADMSQTIRNMDAATLAESRGGSDIASLIRQHGKSSKGSAHETEHIVR